MRQDWLKERKNIGNTVRACCTYNAVLSALPENADTIGLKALASTPVVLPLNELAHARMAAVPVTLPVASVKIAAGPNRPVGTIALSLWTSN